MPQQKLKAAVVGATGIAGQQFLACLADHPWFEVTALAGSPRSAGKTYGEGIKTDKGATGWWADGEVPSAFLNMMVQDSAKFDAASVDLVFTAIESDVARELEPRYAQTTPVISAASLFRMEGDSPLLIPGVNSDHAPLVKEMSRKRGWKGYVTAIPNCTTTGLAITLAPLHRAFGVKNLFMTSMQAISGAGRNGGVLALDAVDNIVPYIVGEEEKVQREVAKIFGALQNGTVAPAPIAVSCTCTRAAVLEGHTESVFVELEKRASVEEVAAAMRAFAPAELEGLPTAPKPGMIHVHDDPFRPQPRLDRDRGAGMVTTVGRIRKDTVMAQGVKYMLVSHNTKMGAAKGAVLVAELLKSQGLL
ncbi:MAG: aspartate-semialdehyde dehydrogenase [candidate division FCPU426 bacterium]